MSVEAETALEGQDPDSLEVPGQEPAEPEAVEPVEDAADPEEVDAAAVEADSAEQPDGAGDDGQPRDEHGRFAPKSAPPESSPPVAEPSPSGEPFRFKVDGIPVEVDGAFEHDGKIIIPRETWDRVVQPKTADRSRIQQTQERMQAEVRRLQSEAEAREERFRTVLGKVDELLGDPEKVRAFVERYQQEAPRFKLEVENALLKSRQQRSETDAKTRSEEAEQREFNELAPSALKNAVDMVVERAGNGSAVDRAAVVEELRGLADAGVPIFFRVTEGDGSGLDPREHRWGVHLGTIEKLVKPYLQLGQKASAADKAAQVEASNAQALKPTKPKAPPVAPASGSPTPGGGAKFPTTREEYEAYKAKRSAELNLPM